MKRLTIAVGLFTVLACSGLQAQPKLEASIPFEFRMGTTTFPAGDYLFDCSSRVLAVHKADGRYTTAMAMTLPAGRSPAPMPWAKSGAAATMLPDG